MANLESILRAHRLTKELQEANTVDIMFSRDVLDIPDEDRADNFTTGTLATAKCFASSPAVGVSRSQQSVLAVYHLGLALTGHRGFVHGGVIATVLDECCGRAAVSYFEDLKLKDNQFDLPLSRAVTARLAVNFLAPVRTDSYIIVKATVQEQSSSKRKAVVAAKMFSTGENTGGNGDSLCAEAESVFIEQKTPKIK